MLNQTQILREGEEVWVWKHEEHKFTVKSTYLKLKTPIIGENYDMFNMFWRIKVAPSSQYFVWRAILNKIATKENLSRIGLQ